MSDAEKRAAEINSQMAAMHRLARAWALPSVAVLPFDVAGDGIIDRYFADGVSTDIAGCLARIPELRVMGSTSPLPWRGPGVEIAEVATTVGAQYILTGSISRDDQRLSFKQKLFDSASSTLVWTDTVEANIDHLFDLQNFIVARVVNGILPLIRQAEIERALLKAPASLSPYDQTLRAVPDIRGLRQEKFEAAKQLLRQAADSDPAYATPVAWLARSNSLMVGQGWSTDRAKACADGMQLARQAIELDPTNSLALSIAGHLSSFLQFDYKMAETLFDRAIAACHNDAFAWSLSAATLFYVGRVEEARQRAAHGLRLSPFDECIHQLYFCMGLACYGCLDYAEAQSWCRKAIAENPHYTVSYKVLTAALVGEGRISEARDVARELRRLEPNFSQNGGITPIADPIIRERYLTQLRTAGALDPVTR